MAECIAFACSNRAVPSECRLFPFPEDQERYFMWIDRLCKAGKDNEWHPDEESRICEFHFEPDQFNDFGLIDDALPSIFYPFAKKISTRSKRKASLLAQSSSNIEKVVPTTNAKEATGANTTLCRLCAKSIKKSAISLFDKDMKNETNIFEFLSKAFDLSVHDGDELPHTICLRCDHKLDDIFRYRHECKMADETLRRWKKDGTVSIVKVESDDGFEFVCANKAPTPKCMVGSVSIELREIKEEPEVTGNEAHAQSVHENKVQKEEPEEEMEDHIAEPSGHSENDDEDVVPLKPGLKKKEYWECPDCEEVLSNRTKLREHRKACEFKDAELSKKKRIQVKNLSKRQRSRPATRQKPNPDTSEADNQRLIDEMLSSQDNEEDDRKLEKRLRPKSQSSREWKCIDCEEILPSRSKLKKHRSECKLVGTPLSKRRKRTDEAPIPCDYCGKMLTCKMGYKQHLTYCIGFDKGEQQAKALDQTVVREAGDEAASETGVDNRVICHICGKKISQRSSMAAHIRFHQKIKPHQCKICSKSYYTASELKEHSGSHDPVKSFICQVCGKGFSARSYLRKHMVVHDPRFKNIQCPFCPKKFIRKCEIQMHLLSHTGAPPNECHICQQKFRFTWELKKHFQKIHGICDETTNTTAAATTTVAQEETMDQMALSSPSSQTSMTTRMDDGSNASPTLMPTAAVALNPLLRPHPLQLSEGLGIGIQTLYNLHSQIEENRYQQHNFPYL